MEFLEDGRTKMQNLKVLYEDNHIIVVKKEPNIPSQADKTGDIDMLSIIKEYLKEKYKVKVYDYTTIGSFKEIGLKFKVIPTKGHSMDSVSFYFEKTNFRVLFSIVPVLSVSSA